jgi:replicative DNA helicase
MQKQYARTRTPAIASFPDLGKIPPQSNDMEEAVLGAVMCGTDVSYAVVEILRPENFYREAHQKIFKVIYDNIKKGKSVDMLIITERLRAEGELECVGGPCYLMQLANKIVATTNVEIYARVVLQKYMQRELIRISTEVQNRAFDDMIDVADLMEYAETNILGIGAGIEKKKARTMGHVVTDILSDVEKVQSGELKLLGIPSGFPSLDRITGGFKPQEFTVIACRPSVGKTAVALKMAENAAFMGFSVGYFSLEMGSKELVRRSVSGVSGSTNTEIMGGRCSMDHLVSTTKKLMRLPIYIDDTSAISLVDLRSKTRRMVMEHGVKMIFVDYLQLMTGEGDSREQEVSYVSRGLKGIAKDYDISVIALSQLNRRLEGTADKTPALSDLRESGSIEQDADIVVFPHRPAQYGQDSVTVNGESIDTKELMLLLVRKNRNGASHVDIKLKHNESVTNIWEEDEFTPVEVEMKMPYKDDNNNPDF